MNAFDRIAESRITEALERGEFEHVEGRGKPLRLGDLSQVPEDLRAVTILLRGAGYVPEEMELLGESLRVAEMIGTGDDADEKQRLQERRSRLLLRHEVLMEQRSEQGR